MIKSSFGDRLSLLDVITYFYSEFVRTRCFVEQNDGRSHVKSACLLALFEAKAWGFSSQVIRKRARLRFYRIVPVPVIRCLGIETIRLQILIMVEEDRAHSPRPDIRHAQEQVIVPFPKYIDSLALSERIHVLLHI